MTDTVIDDLAIDQLRAFARHQARLIDRLLREREQHLVSVEQAFRRRHNDQQALIADLQAALQRKKSA